MVVLPAAAIFLISYYRDAVEHSFDARLSVFLTNLVASAATTSGRPSSYVDLGDPAFTLPFSGWYWQITPMATDARPLATSSSLLDQSLSLPSRQGIPADANNVRRATIPGPEHQQLRILERVITLEEEKDRTQFSYAVAGDSAEVEQAISDFTALLATVLTALGLGLVAATFLQIRFGLRPLRLVRRRLAAIRSGEAELLEGDLPAEIVPLQDELNALLQSNRAVVERARTHVGNLAHALKTPLSIITNESRGKRGPLPKLVAEQAELMRNQVNHHLQRARMAASTAVSHGPVDVEPAIGALVRALTKIYEERGIEISMTCPAQVKFLGEKHDFEEMVGNLLDNACKWAKGSVALKVIRRNDPTKPGGKRLVIFIDDDGPGLTQSKREAALPRGHRLDESKPGTGLGLSIVSELAHVYRGTFKLKVAPLGGLRARLELPAT
jgi:signal transduction histidine kinase